MLPNGLDWLGDDPKPPKAGFCPNKDDPPNAEVDEAPKAGTELPKAGVDEAPNEGVEGKGEEGCPKTPVDVPPNIEPPDCEPKGFGLPKGLGANGLVLELLVCPNSDWEPKGLLEDCPNGLVEPNMAANSLRSRRWTGSLFFR